MIFVHLGSCLCQCVFGNALSLCKHTLHGKTACDFIERHCVKTRSTNVLRFTVAEPNSCLKTFWLKLRFIKSLNKNNLCQFKGQCTLKRGKLHLVIIFSRNKLLFALSGYQFRLPLWLKLHTFKAHNMNKYCALNFCPVTRLG